MILMTGMPSFLSYFWNFGSFLGMIMMFQIMSGILLTFFYNLSFSSVYLFVRDSFLGSFMNLLHANSASILFFFLFLHMLKALVMISSRLMMVWMSGLIILVMIMATAFLGYVLPWGQMSYWGATVITNLISAIPIIGKALVIWIWSGFSVGIPSLMIFYSMHYLLPLLSFMIIMIHLLFLHSYSSTSMSMISKSKFSNFWFKDLLMKDLTSIFVFTLILMMIFMNSDIFTDEENFLPANNLVAPLHIKPEWYFLFAYAILRSIPSKGLGVLGLLSSVVFFMFNSKKQKKEISLFIFMLCMLFFILTWIGGQPVEPPFINIGLITSMLYFYMIIVKNFTL